MVQQDKNRGNTEESGNTSGSGFNLKSTRNKLVLAAVVVVLAALAFSFYYQ